MKWNNLKAAILTTLRSEPFPAQQNERWWQLIPRQWTNTLVIMFFFPLIVYWVYNSERQDELRQGRIQVEDRKRALLKQVYTTLDMDREQGTRPMEHSSLIDGMAGLVYWQWVGQGMEVHQEAEKLVPMHQIVKEAPLWIPDLPPAVVGQIVRDWMPVAVEQGIVVHTIGKGLSTAILDMMNRPGITRRMLEERCDTFLADVKGRTDVALPIRWMPPPHPIEVIVNVTPYTPSPDDIPFTPDPVPPESPNVAPDAK